MKRPRHDTRKLVTLIGMPAAGKTKIGKLLARSARCGFVDIDEVLTKRFGAAKLQEIVSRLSPTEFAAAEEAAAIETATGLLVPTVIATGGSMVYLERAMRHLSRHTHIIYLKVSFETVVRRVARWPDRGIVFAPGETLADLYKRRMPLYEKWAHRTINTDRERPTIAARLAAQLAKEGYL